MSLVQVTYCFKKKQIVAKQLHINNQENNRVNVVKNSVDQTLMGIIISCNIAYY